VGAGKRRPAGGGSRHYRLRAGRAGGCRVRGAAKAAAAFKQRDVFGTIEAVKAVSELYSPVSGTIVETNKALEQDPALVNRDPYGKGWMVKVKLKDRKELEGLLRADAYAKHVGE